MTPKSRESKPDEPRTGTSRPRAGKEWLCFAIQQVAERRARAREWMSWRRARVELDSSWDKNLLDATWNASRSRRAASAARCVDKLVWRGLAWQECLETRDDVLKDVLADVLADLLAGVRIQGCERAFPLRRDGRLVVSYFSSARCSGIAVSGGRGTALARHMEIWRKAPSREGSANRLLVDTGAAPRKNWHCPSSWRRKTSLSPYLGPSGIGWRGEASAGWRGPPKRHLNEDRQTPGPQRTF